MIKNYYSSPCWEIEEIPKETGFNEEITTLILGSRQPILFVEGGINSLDMTIYRCCYPNWTVIPRGSCSEVIRSVATLRKNKEFTRIDCYGVVDADGRDEDDIKNLDKKRS